MVREDQDHLTHCSGYGFSSDEKLVKFYSLVMNAREAYGWD